ASPALLLPGPALDTGSLLRSNPAPPRGAGRRRHARGEWQAPVRPRNGCTGAEFRRAAPLSTEVENLTILAIGNPTPAWRRAAAVAGRARRPAGPAGLDLTKEAGHGAGIPRWFKLEPSGIWGGGHVRDATRG